MKVMTVLGTRPEIIRLSQIIPKLDELCDHVLVHTGQNYDTRLSSIFFDELGVRPPDHYLNVESNSFGEQIGQIIAESEKIIRVEQPDRLLILGDTNSGLAAIVAKRVGVPVYHMEAGNRCYDDRVPEEVNRRVIDHSSDVLMPYTERSRVNLLREGIEGYRVFVTGNPIFEVLNHYDPQIENSQVLTTLDVQPRNFFLVTLHRAENVDEPDRLENFIQGLHLLEEEYGLPIICSLHPRTRSQLEKQSKTMGGVRTLPPLGFFDFVKLEKNARCVFSDSGTVQEECSIFCTPNVTLRDVTERPETMEVGSNILSGANPDELLKITRTALHQPPAWRPPTEYMVDNVSMTVVKILLSFRLLRHHL